MGVNELKKCFYLTSILSLLECILSLLWLPLRKWFALNHLYTGRSDLYVSQFLSESFIWKSCSTESFPNARYCYEISLRSDSTIAIMKSPSDQTLPSLLWWSLRKWLGFRNLYSRPTGPLVCKFLSFRILYLKELLYRIARNVRNRDEIYLRSWLLLLSLFILTLLKLPPFDPWESLIIITSSNRGKF